MNFSEVSFLWLEEKRNYIKGSTYSLYYYETNKYLLSEKEKCKIENISYIFIKNLIAKWQKSLKQSTIHNLISILKQIMQFSVKKQFVRNFEIDFGTLSRQCDINKISVADRNQINKIVQSCTRKLSPKDIGILLALNLGLRIGEICALRWENIDFNNNTICITHTLQRYYDFSGQINNKTCCFITSPKTLTSNRIIPLSDKIVFILKKAMPQDKTGFILSNSEKIIEPRNMRRYFSKICKTNGISDLHFHSLRHTFASLCLENNCDFKTVSEILGHSDVKITMNIYMHPSLSKKRHCIESIGVLDSFSL